MDFGQALNALKEGKKVARAGWNGKGMWLILIHHLDYSVHPRLIGALFEAPYIGIKTTDNKFVPWVASQTDLLAEDWEVVE